MQYRVYSIKDSRFLNSWEFVLSANLDLYLANLLDSESTIVDVIQQDYVIQKSTGLTDKHGVNIFEGDIVLCYKWFDGTESKPRKRSKITVSVSTESNIENVCDGGYDGCWHITDLEIVGNIFENN